LTRKQEMLERGCDWEVVKCEVVWKDSQLDHKRSRSTNGVVKLVIADLRRIRLCRTTQFVLQFCSLLSHSMNVWKERTCRAPLVALTIADMIAALNCDPGERSLVIDTCDEGLSMHELCATMHNKWSSQPSGRTAPTWRVEQHTNAGMGTHD
jgi:hypothetical protein